MNFNLTKLTKEQRKAVAPIIATLLMVAISVVGGILIFVFAQGFFQDTSIQSPTIDSIEIFGYNANDTATSFFLHNGDDEDLGGARTSTLAESDPFALYLRNTGSVTTSIESVRVYGIKYSFDITNAGSAIATTKPAILTYLLIRSGTDGYLENQLIEPGQEVTLIMRYDSTNTNGDVKVGRPILVQVKTGSGGVFTKQMRNGVETT